MGLTIYYHLRSDAATPEAAHSLVRKLARRAQEMPFQRVLPVEPYPGRAADDRGETSLWLCSSQTIERRQQMCEVRPRHAFAFFLIPGAGCEWAALGLAKYPQSSTLPDGRRVRTGLAGWSWNGFCKTQYASDPRHGGFENFRRCHVSLIELFDYAAQIGLQVDLQDEAGYAQVRDTEALRQTINQWNEVIAAGIGRLRDALPGESEAPITRYPNFEHLEARGSQAMRGDQ